MTERLLRVVAPHFVAAAVWEKPDGKKWTCTEAAPILYWMVGKKASYLRQYIDRKRREGWEFSWI